MVSEYQFLYTLYCLISKYTTHSHEIAKCKEICRLLRCIESHSHSPFAAFHFFFVCFCSFVFACIDCINLYWYCMVYSFYFYFGSFLEYLYSVSNNTIRHCSMWGYSVSNNTNRHCSMWGLALYSYVVNTDIVLIQSYYKMPAPMSKSEQSCKCQGYRVCH